MKHAAKMRRTFGITLAATALSAVAFGAQGQETFKIGAIFPMSGPSASAGFSSAIGARMAVEEANAAGGILGRKVELVIADDKFDTTQSVAMAKKLIFSDKVQVVIGPISSALAEAVAPVMTEENILFFSTGGPLRLVPSVAPTFFSMQVAPEDQAVTMLDWAKNARKAKSVAMLTDSSPNSKAMVERFNSYAKEIGIQNAGTQQFEVGQTDMTPELLSLRRNNPDVVLLSGSLGADIANILKNLADLNWNVQIGSSNTVSALYAPIANQAGPAIKRVLAAVQIKAFTYCTGDPVGQSTYAKFLPRLKAADPASFGKISISLAAWYTDAVRVARAGVNGVGSADGRKVAKWIEDNASKVPAITGDLVATTKSHFLGAKTIAMMEDLGNVRSDGLMKRAGC